MNQIYAYVDGSDLHEVENLLLPRFSDFIAKWGVPSAAVVNDKLARSEIHQSQDLPDWNIGLNFDVETLSPARIEELLKFLADLVTRTGREFAIGVWHQNEGLGEDLFFIDAEFDSRILALLTELLQ
ncbi:hypothetical protein ACN9MZ_06185 [Pseudoduganella sp. S-14]|jgi:hypothetical protein|uniref:hypothetical protein n=1 Tax=Pseudoduganella sp. S-14 TaxID=3404065 RepID=UPI003CF46D57